MWAFCALIMVCQLVVSVCIYQRVHVIADVAQFFRIRSARLWQNQNYGNASLKNSTPGNTGSKPLVLNNSNHPNPDNPSTENETKEQIQKMWQDIARKTAKKLNAGSKTLCGAVSSEPVDTSNFLRRNDQVWALVDENGNSSKKRLVQLMEKHPNYTKPKDVSVTCVDKRIALHVIDNFLTPERCKMMIDYADEIYTPRSTGAEGDGNKIIPGRTSRTFSHNGDRKDSIFGEMYDLLPGVLNLDQAHMENLQIQIYKPGQFYRPHYDSFDVHSEFYKTQASKQGGQRLWTIIVYLSDVEDGGETEFPELNGLRVKSKQGRAVVWRSYTFPNKKRDPLSYHGGCDVLKGKKYLVTGWFRENKFWRM